VRAATVFALVAGCVAMALAPVEMQLDQSAREDAARGPTVDGVPAPAQALPPEGSLAPSHDDVTGPARPQKPRFMGCSRGKALARRFLETSAMSSTVSKAGSTAQGSGTNRAETMQDTDMLHYQLEFEISDIDPIGGSCWLAGSNRMQVRSLSSNLTEFSFRLWDAFTITNALLNDTTPATVATPTWTTRVVTLDRTYGLGEEFFLTIEYEGYPEIWVGEESGVPFVATLSEAWWAFQWWPVKDGDVDDSGDLSDKATMEFSITVPGNFSVPSNGVLLSTEPLDGGARKRYNWASDYPNTAYGVSFAVSEYNRWTETYYSSGGEEMPVEFYIYDAWDDPFNRAGWSLSVDMIGVFAGLWGEYPFINEKYGIYNFPWGGGMEHQTMTGQGGGTYAFDEDLTAHELAHSWWGNMVTCKYWNDIWINEGFATHGECLWHEFQSGTSNPSEYFNCMQMHKPMNAGADGTVYVYPWELTEGRIFSGTYSYAKGAWVLHQLRGVVGDGVFFDILADFRAAHAFSAATTDEFVAIASARYGQDLTWFFDQWVYNAGAPDYAYTWEMVPARGREQADVLHVSILQEQQPPSPDVFVMPVDLVVTIGGIPETLTVWNDSRSQTYDLPVSGVVTDVQFDPNQWILRSVCGNNVPEPGEDCDGFSDSACPGLCLPPGDPNECECPAPVCGNNIREGAEVCDGTDDSACTGSSYCLPPGDPDECTCACPDAAILVKIFTDAYPPETTWVVTDHDTGSFIASGGPYLYALTLYTAVVCVNSTGCYDFTIYDSYGDGICCDLGAGYYEVYYEEALVGSGGDFGSSETVASIGGCSSCGNGDVDDGEACDDGNTVDCDGCRGDCSSVEGTCGDDTLDTLCEVCDDGNNADCDGCRGDCSAVDCDDGNECTDDSCEGIPEQCVNAPVSCIGSPCIIDAECLAPCSCNIVTSACICEEPPPPPDPHDTVPGLGNTQTNFGNSVIPAIAADFFEPGSEPFEGDIEFEGITIGLGPYGEASTWIARSADPIQPEDPVETIGIVDVELVALSLKSLSPIEVVTDGQPAHWDVAVTLSDTSAGQGTLTASKTHCNGGTFDMTVPVNPLLTFTKVDGPGMPPGTTRTLDAAAEGEPPIVLSTEGAPWVHSLWDPNVDIDAPSDGTFVPGVEEVPACSGPGEGARVIPPPGSFQRLGGGVERTPESIERAIPPMLPAGGGGMAGVGGVGRRGGQPDPECPADSLFAQPVDVSWLWEAATSDAYTSWMRFESFSGVAQPICDIHWWGYDMAWVDGGWVECTENPMPFEIKFYQDAGGLPGAEVCSYSFTSDGTYVANLGWELWGYSEVLDPCCVITDGWVSIVGAGNPACYFLWANSYVGDGSNCNYDGATFLCGTSDNYSHIDLSVCLTPASRQQVVPVPLGNPPAGTWHTVVPPNLTPPLNPPALPTDPTHQVRKHRYISVDPNTNPTVDTVLKVEVAQMKRCENAPTRGCETNSDCDDVCDDSASPPPHYMLKCPPANCALTDPPSTCIWSGPCVDLAPTFDPPLAWVVQQPEQDPTGGCKKPGCPPYAPGETNCCTDEDWMAYLGPTVPPLTGGYTNWSDVWADLPLGLLHITDCGIVPVVTYAVYACNPDDLSQCGSSLMVGTQRFPVNDRPIAYHLYGDVCGGTEGDPPEVLPPDGYVSVKDLLVENLTIINYGSYDLPQMHITWADFHGPGPGMRPNYNLGVADLMALYVFGLVNGHPWVNTQGGLDPQHCGPFVP
jgi:cysteine-rich repeat protein